MNEVLKEITTKATEALGDHVLGCVIIGGYPRRKRGDIDVVVVVDTEEAMERVEELQEELKKEYDLHPMTLETLETKLFL